MKLKAYSIIERAVEEGVTYGYNRAFKHTDAPKTEVLKDSIANAVMNEICEIMDFSDTDGEPVKILNEGNLS